MEQASIDTAAKPKRVRPSRATVVAVTAASKAALPAAPVIAIAGKATKKPAKPLAPASQQNTKAAKKLPAVVSTKAVTLAPAKKVDAQDKRAAKLATIKKAVSAPARVIVTRMSNEDRKAQLLAAAVKVAGKMGYTAVTRDAVAIEAKVSVTLPSRYFGNMDGLRDAIVKSAVETKNVKLIAEALVHKHQAVRKAKEQYRADVVKFLFD